MAQKEHQISRLEEKKSEVKCNENFPILISVETVIFFRSFEL
jgi:hypothetical protein